ncbi:hypothetical protein [Qipengyuania nanhaisediminis]|uniref:Uncharacterized protein n=1 Tax=Qipengyuania nanhaisediminis TaxID=604088 RepID=A0A1I5LMR3_9SPHN|nr:hypothetical protein [Qipengyuania nanhaisediminis]SFO98096.1 hypothetical protein SAMN04488060_1096 [Qipengyuania nanhaisediminis]
MSDANFASLSSTLLARKGGAKPAMRPQSTAIGPVDGAAAAANLEDLGWNDMGDEAQSAAPEAGLVKMPADVVSIAPKAANESGEPNQVRASLDRIASQLEKKPEEKQPVQRKSALRQGKRAAFTLRLDQERHLMLRLACTVRGSSAQQLVTDALDGLLAEMPEIAALAAQVQHDGK